MELAKGRKRKALEDSEDVGHTTFLNSEKHWMKVRRSFQSMLGQTADRLVLYQAGPFLPKP